MGIRNRLLSMLGVMIVVLTVWADRGFGQAPTQRWEQLMQQFERHLDRDDWSQAFSLVQAFDSEILTLDPDGPESLRTAAQFARLAGKLRLRDRFAEAEQVYMRLIGLRERSLGSNHPAVGQTLNEIGLFYSDQSKFAEAAGVLTRALSIAEEAYGTDHTEVASALNNLGVTYRTLGRLDEAEPLFERALGILEDVHGAEHGDVAATLNNLALLYYTQRRYARAEPLYERAVEVFRNVFGTEHPNLAMALNNLAGLYRAQGRTDKAEGLYRQALEIREEGIRTGRSRGGLDSERSGTPLPRRAQVWGSGAALPPGDRNPRDGSRTFAPEPRDDAREPERAARRNRKGSGGW